MPPFTRPGCKLWPSLVVAVLAVFFMGHAPSAWAQASVQGQCRRC